MDIWRLVSSYNVKFMDFGHDSMLVNKEVAGSAFPLPAMTLIHDTPTG